MILNRRKLNIIHHIFLIFNFFYFLRVDPRNVLQYHIAIPTTHHAYPLEILVHPSPYKHDPFPIQNSTATNPHYSILRPTREKETEHMLVSSFKIEYHSKVDSPHFQEVPFPHYLHIKYWTIEMEFKRSAFVVNQAWVCIDA